MTTSLRTPASAERRVARSVLRPAWTGPRTRHVVFADALRRWTRADVAPLPADEPGRGPELGLEDGAFVRWLLERAGLDVDDYRAETLRRRLGPCLRALRVGTPAEARPLIEAEPAHLPTAVNALLLGVTGFFRDPAVFSALGDDVLRGLLAERSALRIWSVGCSDGAELYSVAMLLARDGAPPAGHELVGTDCRPDAIRHARAGVFDARALESVPAALRARWTEPQGNAFRIVTPLREAVRWRTGNALAVPEPGPWDVILCRNLLMYLRSRASFRLCRALAGRLRSGGVLVVGKAERPSDASLCPVRPCIYRRAA